MRLQIQQHEELALQHMEAFYCILGQRRELWNSGDEYIAPHDLRFGEACYFLGAAQWSAQLAIWHIEQANNLASPSLWKTTLLASDVDYSMDVHWESVDQ